MCCNPAGKKRLSRIWNGANPQETLLLRKSNGVIFAYVTKKTKKKQGAINEETQKCHFQCFKSFYSQPKLDQCLVLHFTLAKLINRHVVLRCTKSVCFRRALRCCFFFEQCVWCELTFVQLWNLVAFLQRNFIAQPSSNAEISHLLSLQCFRILRLCRVQKVVSYFKTFSTMKKLKCLFFPAQKRGFIANWRNFKYFYLKVLQHMWWKGVRLSVPVFTFFF